MGGLGAVEASSASGPGIRTSAVRQPSPGSRSTISPLLSRSKSITKNCPSVHRPLRRPVSGLKLPVVTGTSPPCPLRRNWLPETSIRPLP
jgi:hypothetical protein